MNMLEIEQIVPIFWGSITGKINFGRKSWGLGLCWGHYDRVMVYVKLITCS